MLENYQGMFCCLNSEKIPFSSEIAKSLLLPTDEIVYYESIRIKNGVLLFFEDHMLRLYKSIEAKESFIFDSEKTYTDAQMLIQDTENPVSDGSLRVTVTKSKVLLYLSSMVTPPEEFYRNGVAAVILKWERKTPQVKIFHDDYKTAVAEAFTKTTQWGEPYEVLLENRKGELTEGSRSNFFILLGNTVYSPPDSLILIGITRKYVEKAIIQAGLVMKEKLFTFDELCELRDQGNTPAIFLTSSPFDILPVKSINDEFFESSVNLSLEKIQKIYHNIVEAYMLYHNPVLPDQEG